MFHASFYITHYLFVMECPWYMGLDRPSACLLTAADSLLSYAKQLVNIHHTEIQMDPRILVEYGLGMIKLRYGLSQKIKIALTSEEVEIFYTIC